MWASDEGESSYTALRPVLYVFAKYLYLHKWVKRTIKDKADAAKTHLCSYLLNPKPVSNHFQS